MRPAALVAFLLASLPHSTVSALAGSEPPPKRVLVIYWYGKDYPINVRTERGVRAVLQSMRPSVEYYPEYLETNRFPGEHQSRLLHDYLAQKYAELPIDVVIASGIAVVDFLLQHRRTLFPKAPIVFIGGGDRKWRDIASGPGITGITVFNNLRKSLDLALAVHPQTQRAFVISGTRERDRRLESRARLEFDGYARDVDVSYLTDLPLHELIVQVKNLPPRSIALYTWHQTQNERGRVLESEDIVASIATLASVPIYGMSETTFGRGILGGEIFTNERNGARAAEIALAILGGTSARDIPIENAHTTAMFDRRQLERWGIDDARLPPGSIIRFENPSLWDRYKQYIVAVALFSAVQGALLIALLIQRASRRRAELVALARQRELTHMSRIATVGQLTGTIAHEMRQPLAAILMNAQAAREALSRQSFDRAELVVTLDEIVRSDERAAAVIDRLRGVLRRGESRHVALSLNDVVGDALSLVARELTTRDVIVTTQLAPGIPNVLGDRVELQQVLVNLILNATDAMSSLPPAKRVLAVRTMSTPFDTVQVSVSDQGPGLPADCADRVFESFFTTKEHGLGLGLAISRSIISAHKGSIWGESNAGAGATFSFRLPVPRGPDRVRPVSRLEYRSSPVTGSRTVSG